MSITTEQQIDLLADLMAQLEAAFNERIRSLSARLRSLEQEVDEIKGYTGFYTEARYREGRMV